ncbi:SRCR-like domain-containing protein, partial [Baffinella frigidus]
RLETKFANEWGSVCGKDWGPNNAEAVCSALGFSEGGRGIPDFGGGYTSPAGHMLVWLSQVQCAGTEGDVGDCAHAPWGETVGCAQPDVVGICCWGAG